MDSRIITADGTETLFNEEFGEAYHSTKAGAYTESLEKFIKPTKVVEKSLKNGKVSILDVGFGLGYNVSTAISEIRKNSNTAVIDIVSVEKDINVFNKIRKLNKPNFLKEVYDLILSGDFSSQFEYKIYTVNKDNVSLKVIFGEGRKVLKFLSKEGKKFDAVFYDPFSPKVNTEMWTVNIFKLVRNLMMDDSILATYSASLAVRKGLIEAGFKIGLVDPVGRKSFSTVASVNGEIPPITKKEKLRLENSPFAVPYYDNDDLTLSRNEILRNWQLKIGKKS
ncbi:tRNA (5-methylaminomethyl-2-thiouridine)(34)-methyltransferase MnmD [Persephonella sp.]